MCRFDRRNGQEFVKHLCALLLFGLNGIVASRIALNSYEIVFLRTLIGSVLLICVFLLGKGRFHWKVHKRDAAFIVLSGAAMGKSEGKRGFLWQQTCGKCRKIKGFQRIGQTKDEELDILQQEFDEFVDKRFGKKHQQDTELVMKQMESLQKIKAQMGRADIKEYQPEKIPEGFLERILERARLHIAGLK